jgi:hypothetical protein
MFCLHAVNIAQSKNACPSWAHTSTEASGQKLALASSRPASSVLDTAIRPGRGPKAPPKTLKRGASRAFWEGPSDL